MKRSTVGFLVTMLFLAGCASTPKNLHIVKTATTDGLRIELNVLPAEPFHSADQVKANPDLKGMLVVGGAKPFALDAQPRPNCHLIVHVFDAESGKALTEAKVRIKYQRVEWGKPKGPETEVPVVIMQVIGKGPDTTHYGNNVMLPEGSFAVTVVANGKKAVFHIHR